MGNRASTHRSRLSPGRIGRIVLLSAALVVTGCVEAPVEWGDVSYRQSQLGDPDARSAVMSANLPAISGTSDPCIRSIHTAGDQSELFRVWWSSRNDSSVVLLMQRSGDQGRNWEAPLEVESRDHGGRGCNRPAPGIFYDSASGYVHLVYFVEASDGAGASSRTRWTRVGCFTRLFPSCTEIARR